MDHLTGRYSVQVLGDFFRLTLIYNFGGAMGTSLGPSLYYLVMAIVVLPFVLIYLYRYRSQKIVAFPLAFIAGGALGNLIDRIYLGKVVDFLDFDVPDIDVLGYTLDRFWAFNFADSAITCGVVFLVAYMLFFHREPAENRPPDTPADGGSVDSQQAES